MGQVTGERRRLRFWCAGVLLVPVGLAGVVGVGPAQAATGSPPTAAAGADQTVTLVDTAFLRGQVSDDGLPDPSQLAVTWSKVSGPGDVRFGRTDEAHTSADFSEPGDYVLRLTVSDGGGTSSDDLAVTVRSSAGTTLRVPADYPTIQAALDAAPAHALVLVSPGTYNESLVVPRTLTLASTFYTTGDRSRVDQTVLHGTLSGVETLAVAPAAGPDTHIVGFTFNGGKDGVKVNGAAVVQDNVFNTPSDAVDLPKGTAALVKHNVMRGNGDDGVDMDVSSAVIVDNLMQQNSGDGVETRVTNHTAPLYEVIIRNNRILASRQDGVQIIDDDAIAAVGQSSTVLTLDRNIIAGNQEAGVGLMDGGNTSENYAGASLTERILVTNNTFDGNNHGVTGGDNLVAVNNVFEHHTNIAVKNVDGASRVAYNRFFANGTNYVGSNVDAATTSSGDPLLDASYTPLSGSPVIDAGTATYTLPSGEVAVTVRDYAGAAPDLGAVESAGGGGGGPVNAAPVVGAGPDGSVVLPGSFGLDGSVSDDGLPAGSVVVSTWSKVSGPGSVSFGDPGAVDTSASFSVAGVYELALSASDGQLTGSDSVVVRVDPADSGGGSVSTVEVRVAAGSDDAEQSPSGSVNLTSSDLELVADGNTVQTVGLRFVGVQVPRGARVTGAYLQFQTDEVSTGAASLTVQGQAADNPATFTTGAANVSGRARTSAAVSWQPVAWSTVGERGVGQRTADLAGVVQEIVNRAGWASGNAMAFVLTGTGRRTAVAFEGGGAASLVVSYSTDGGGGPVNAAPVVGAGSDGSVVLPGSFGLDGSVSDDGLPAGSVVVSSWSKVSGPGSVSFGDPGAVDTSASFSVAGVYELAVVGVRWAADWFGLGGGAGGSGRFRWWVGVDGRGAGGGG